jgi:DNA-binding response OmpR family regulator
MAAAALPVSPPRVLVVDDDPIVLEIVKEVLSEAGYRMDTRSQALGTAQWVAKEQPDFVLLDVKMPALSGSELTQLIRRKEATSQVAVILHSSIAVDELNALAQRSGALSAIKKTPSTRLFLAEFERLVARSRAYKTR